MSDRPDDDAGWLTIGELAERTGVLPTTLRMWESRHGFPRPERADSRHRRYAVEEAEHVAEVLRLRAAGVRLGPAIERTVHHVGRPATSTRRSVYAELRHRHPGLPTHQLRKTTLRGLSWAIEDEIRASVTAGVLFGAFQEQRFYAAARPRWRELAGYASGAFVYADFPAADREHGLTSVPLAAGAPLRSEWAVVCDGPDFRVALSAWELPRQEPVRDRDRLFEAVWTIDPVPVRDAARVFARVAAEAGAPGAEEAVDRLTPEVAVAPVDAAATALYSRVVAYVDREHR